MAARRRRARKEEEEEEEDDDDSFMMMKTSGTFLWTACVGGGWVDESTKKQRTVSQPARVMNHGASCLGGWTEEGQATNKALSCWQQTKPKPGTITRPDKPKARRRGHCCCFLF